MQYYHVTNKECNHVGRQMIIITIRYNDPERNVEEKEKYAKRSTHKQNSGG